jgi:deoxyribonuclease V|tara:strand:- start:1809 stop:2318 length:510 start_codon:yes stop_codon:yes gene_type:complete
VPLTIQEAKVLQETLSCCVVQKDYFQAIRTVAGIDVGFYDANMMMRAAVVVLQFSSLVVLEQAIARRLTSFPYVLGFLSFRELPVVLDALQQLTMTSYLLLCDGHGIAHPRRFGIEAHLCVRTDLSSIGVAKSILVGMHDVVPQERGVWRPLWQREECVGVAVRTRTKT